MSRVDKLLKDEVRRAIYDLGWKGLRPLQEEAVEAITQTTNDVIISAPTASGKTEAAFLPSISEAIPEITSSLKIVYISPLKALINDQLGRVEDICKHLNCRVTKWHMDASQSQKNKFLKDPSGVLLITPESLESFLINRSPLIYDLFRSVDCYIIDEVHCFVGGARGDQLKSVLNRFDLIIKKRPRRILLSATIGSPENYKIWLDNKEPRFVEDAKKEEKRGSIRYFDEHIGKCHELKKITSQGKKLIFGNSKSHLEQSCVTLKELSEDRSKKIDIHHGSLSKEQREWVEHRLKTEPSLAVFCTNTLELGIDIGNIDEVSLIDPPSSVASFIQKIGRSGRREGSKIEFSFVMSPSLREGNTNEPQGNIKTNLVQSIALVELMKENWCEPGRSQTNSYSTFVHQVMAFLAQKRSVNVEQIWEAIVVKSFSEVVSRLDFQEIIGNLIEKDYLRKNGRGSLILGSKGDRLTESYDFYSVFFTLKEWTVRTERKPLGKIPLQNLFVEGDVLLLSGRPWRVKGVDFGTKVLEVVPDVTGKLPRFSGSPAGLHRKIHEKMRSIYEGDESFKYLTKDSVSHLSLARKQYGILEKSEKFLPIFAGSGAVGIANFILEAHKCARQDLGIGFCLQGNIDKSAALAILKEYTTVERITELFAKVPIEKLSFEKFDELLPKSVLQKAFFNSVFDVKGFLEFIANVDKVSKVA